MFFDQGLLVHYGGCLVFQLCRDYRKKYVILRKTKKNRDNVIQRDRISHCPNEYGRKEERIRQGR